MPNVYPQLVCSNYSLTEFLKVHLLFPVFSSEYTMSRLTIWYHEVCINWIVGILKVYIDVFISSSHKAQQGRSRLMILGIARPSSIYVKFPIVHGSLIQMDQLWARPSNHARNLSKALYRWLIPFFSSFVISANVLSQPLGWKTGSHPKLLGPLAGTISPYYQF